MLLDDNDRLKQEVISLRNQLQAAADKEEGFQQMRLSFHNLFSENLMLVRSGALNRAMSRI